MESSSSSSSSAAWVFPQPSSTALFCPNCHALLELPDSEERVVCPSCRFVALLSEFEQGQLSAAAAKPQLALAMVRHRTSGSAAYSSSSSSFKRATINEPCPQCGYKKLTFYTLQLRSVDEGQTVFFECAKCGHAYSTNT